MVIYHVSCYRETETQGTKRLTEEAQAMGGHRKHKTLAVPSAPSPHDLLSALEPERGWLRSLEMNLSFALVCSHTEILTQPYLRVNNIILERWKSAIFECLSPDTGVDITWFFNNKPLDFNKRMALSPEKRRLIIVPLRVKDTGEYQCEVSNSFSSRKSNPISLILIRM